VTHSIRLCNLSPFTYSGRAPTGKSTLFKKNRPNSVIDFFLIVTEWLSTEVKDNYFTDLMIGSPSIPLHRRLFATGLLCSAARLAGTAMFGWSVEASLKLCRLSLYGLHMDGNRLFRVELDPISMKISLMSSGVTNVVGRGDKIQRPPSGGAPSSRQKFFKIIYSSPK